jgi:tocopherol cyclase
LFRSMANIWRPAIYQGGYRMKAHFEGWYFKLVDEAESNIYAVIPGVSFDKVGGAHCFIQLLNGKDATSRYFRYDISSFRYSDGRFQIWVGQSYFSSDRIELNLSGDGLDISGSLGFKGITAWPATLLSPGAMGWYAFMPFMECYHGVISFDHVIQGSLKIAGRDVDFSGGRGYIEKDWGRSFPYYYAWAQSNHFEEPGTSIMVSIANVPWLRKSFDGFMVGFLHENRLYRFTTYNGARLKGLDVKPQSLDADFATAKHVLQVEAHKSKDAPLAAPMLGSMEGRIAESMTSQIRVRLSRLERDRQHLIYDGMGRNAGLEIAGDIAKFQPIER